MIVLWTVLLWAGCFLVSGSLMAADLYKDLGDYSDAPWLLIALGPVSVVICVIIWVTGGCPTPRFDWLIPKKQDDESVLLTVGGVRQGYGAQAIVNTALSNIMAVNALIAAQMVPFPASATNEPPLDPAAPNTMGWRWWVWNPERSLLMSPIQRAVWETPELRCETWDEDQIVRGVAGIHARLVPLQWTTAVSDEVPQARGWQSEGIGSVGTSFYAPIITGLVERFGRFVLGTEGWRAEHVVIRKLYAPTTAIGLEIERAYPDVEVVYPKPKATIVWPFSPKEKHHENR